MRKIFLFILLFSFFSHSFANDNLLNTDCFYYKTNLKIDENLDFYLINSDKEIDYAKNENGNVFMKLYETKEKKLDYKINGKRIVSLLDNNYSTFFNYYVGLEKSSLNEIILDFGELVGENVNANINIDSKNYIPKYYISKDGRNYEKINLYSLNTFSFRYFKIKFEVRNSQDFISENIKIRDIIFKKISKKYIFKGNSGKNLELYSNFICAGQKDFLYFNSFTRDNNENYKYLKYKSGIKEYQVLLKQNLDYDLVDKGSDIDGDGVLDDEDNCKYDYNPNQLDSNTNLVGDICDDDDGDGFLGKDDNCPYLKNPSQKDIDNNKVGDDCEFDKDNDGIFDSLDNCINTKNPNQEDSDNDGIGDVCDNCNLYNPRQKDKNENNIGDVCEDYEKYIKENDEDKDGILDYRDNCKILENPNQEDSDKDGVGDVCDNCKNIKNTNQKDENKNNTGDMCEDIDGDSFLGYNDNCPYISNKDQKDQDNDGIGDFCEDDDNDGVFNYEDNCKYKYNPNQENIDKDGFGDACDKEDNRFIESNKYFFIGIVVFFFLLFNFFIYLMFRKMKKIEKNYKDNLKKNKK